MRNQGTQPASKALLLDTSFSAKPIYDSLLSFGLQVYVMGGNPTDFLAKTVGNYINSDYSIISNVQSGINKYGIDLIVPGGNDLSYKICAEMNVASSYLNIDTPQNNATINDKEKFRIFADKAGLHIPRIVEAESVGKHLPVIVKPVDAYSGHGMSVLTTDNEVKLRSAIATAQEVSKSGSYLIEEFVNGQLYSHSAFVSNGEIVTDFIVKEYCFTSPYAVDTSHLVYDFDSNLLNGIRTDITKVVKSLDLVDGLMHTQFIVQDDTFWLIEITRRCPGDLYSKLIELSTGFPYAEYYTRPFVGKSYPKVAKDSRRSYVVRHTITVPRRSNFNSFEFFEPTQIVKFVPLAISGDLMEPSPIGRIGIIYTVSRTEAEMNDVVNKIENGDLYSTSCDAAAV